MNLAHGKISLVTDPDIGSVQQVLYTAPQDVRIEYMLFVNTSADPAFNLNLWIQYEDEIIRILRKDFIFNDSDDKEIVRYLYLKLGEKILATCSIDEAIEYHINGSLKVTEIITDEDTGDQYNVDVPGNYGYGYGENYGG